MESVVIIELLEVLEKYKLIPCYLLRNERIKAEYRLMKEKGISSKVAKENLSNKHNLSVKAIEVIVYEKVSK
jgi:hypothetical protein